MEADCRVTRTEKMLSTSEGDVIYSGPGRAAIAPNGDVYVVGTATGQWLTRRSTNGGRNNFV